MKFAIRNALSIGNTIIRMAHEEKTNITAGKLHKLLICAQYYHIGNFKVPLFFNPIVVEENGAFIPDLYDYLGKFGCGPIYRKICVEDCLILSKKTLLKRTLTPIPETIFPKSEDLIIGIIQNLMKKTFEDLKTITEKDNNAYWKARTTIGIGAEILKKDIYEDFHKVASKH